MPSGWAQAPRPSTRSASCSTRADLRRGRRRRRARPARRRVPGARSRTARTGGPSCPRGSAESTPTSPAGRPPGRAPTAPPLPATAPTGVRSAADRDRWATCSAVSQAPEYPPTSRPRNGPEGPPAACRTAVSGAPSGTSSTPGTRTAPLTVTSIVPGSAAVPASRNQSGPYRTSRPRWASVSTLCTSVGRPRTPFSDTRGGVLRGSAGPPSTARTTADSWPDTKPAGAVDQLRTDRVQAGPVPLGQRGSHGVLGRPGAAGRARHAARRPPGAATCRPSSTRCGAPTSSVRSLALAGSPSAPLPMTTGCRPAATARSLRCAGNRAPPRGR